MVYRYTEDTECDLYGMYGKSQYLVYGSHSCSEIIYYVSDPDLIYVTSATVITLAVPTAVMASTDRSTAVRAYNVLSLLLICYAHWEEHLAMMVSGRTSLTVRCGCPIPLKEGCKSVMKWNSGDVKNCECSQHNCLISPGLTYHCKNCFSCFPPYRVPLYDGFALFYKSSLFFSQICCSSFDLLEKTHL